MKKQTLDYDLIKRDFKEKFFTLLNNNFAFRLFLNEIFVYGSAYIVGGFLRDVINNKESRDIDMIVDLEHNKLIEIINNSSILYGINRHNGIKINFGYFQVDLWSIENNWAFKNKLVKLNEEKKLDSIAKGCFYNFDSLVINVHTLNMNIRHYSSFNDTNELDILQRKPLYKILNPTKEANILRAFFLRKAYNVTYSENAKQYILSKILELKDKSINPIAALIRKKSEYPKYDSTLSATEIELFINEIVNDNQIGNQFLLEL